LLTVYISATDKQVWKVVLGVPHHFVIVECSYLCEGRIQEYLDVSLDLLDNQVRPEDPHKTKPDQVSREPLLQIELCPINLRLGDFELIILS
jgi:hypothetical protein